jgi:hypothetical protein
MIFSERWATAVTRNYDMKPLVGIDEISGQLACLLARQRLDHAIRYAPGP